MSNELWTIVIGGSQLFIAFLLWAGLDWSTIRKRWPNVQNMNLGKSKVILILILGGFLFTGYGVVRSFERQCDTGIKIASQKHFRPTDAKYGSGLSLTLRTDRERNEAVQIFVVCDGSIGLAPNYGFSSRTGNFEVESQMLIASHADVWNVKWRPDKWEPGEEVTFNLMSSSPIQAKWVFPVSYNSNVNPNR